MNRSRAYFLRYVSVPSTTPLSLCPTRSALHPTSRNVLRTDSRAELSISATTDSITPSLLPQQSRFYCSFCITSMKANTHLLPFAYNQAERLNSSAAFTAAYPGRGFFCRSLPRFFEPPVSVKQPPERIPHTTLSFSNRPSTLSSPHSTPCLPYSCTVLPLHWIHPPISLRAVRLSGPLNDLTNVNVNARVPLLPSNAVELLAHRLYCRTRLTLGVLLSFIHCAVPHLYSFCCCSSNTNTNLPCSVRIGALRIPFHS